MAPSRNLRGWIYAVLIAIMLTAVFYCYEDYSKQLGVANFQAKRSSRLVATSTEPHGIVMVEDAGMAPTDLLSEPNELEIVPQEPESVLASLSPEPVAEVSLMAPVVTSDTDAIAAEEVVDPSLEPVPLQSTTPSALVSMARRLQDESLAVDNETLRNPRPLNSGGWPSAPALAKLLDELSQEASIEKFPEASDWHSRVQEALVELWGIDILSGEPSLAALDKLTSLAEEGKALTVRINNRFVSPRVLRVVYALERRLAIWRAVWESLQKPSDQLISLHRSETTPADMVAPLNEIRRLVANTADAKSWENYLLLSEVQSLSQTERPDAKVAESLARRYLSRVNWQRLSPAQMNFVQAAPIQTLKNQLQPWAEQPVDYRKMLVDLELLEEDPINRCRTTLAETMQTLRFSQQPELNKIAQSMNDHYRNANLRLAVSAKLIERLLPEAKWEYRPVRRRILGADTRGDSQVKTELAIDLIPDARAWHIKLGLQGEILANTRSVKGPATLYNRQDTDVATQRILRLSTQDFQIQREQTAVSTSDRLKGFETPVDGLPLISDFFRAVVQEQFEQQRGVARNLVRRIVSSEVDQELDQRLESELGKAEQRLNEKLLVPLSRLQLQPLVVDLNTTEDRLTVRYRVAGQTQMAAHTPRPRAPSDSLLSFQMHQSALNNTVAQLGLGDRDWQLPELCEKLAAAFGNNQLQVSDEVPTDVTIRFAQTRPISIEFDQGRMWLTLRIAQLHQEDGIHLERFIVRTCYIPVADGLQAQLVHQGPINIDGQRLGIRERLPIRLIFSKVFTARSTVPVIQQSLTEDPRAADLAVSQFEIRDGWFAMAVSPQSSPHIARLKQNLAELNKPAVNQPLR